MSGSRRLRRAAGLGAVGLALAVAVGGCSANRDNSGATADGAAGQPEKVAPGAAEGQPQGPAADKDVPADLRVNQRSIIYTGSVTVRVDNVERRAAQAVSIATAAGGFVGGDQRSRDGSHSQATLQLRIPASRFTAVVGELAGLGVEERREISTQDVTEEALDLDARISTQRARVDSGRRLLAQAKSLSELVSLESELAKREADLASLEAKKRRIDDLAALSTITLVLLDQDRSTATAGEPRTGFLAGLAAGWKALVASLQVLLTLVGALLPWLVLLGGPVLAVLWWYRRARRRPLPATAAAVPPPAEQ
jgi:hypothetical protein